VRVRNAVRFYSLMLICAVSATCVTVAPTLAQSPKSSDQPQVVNPQSIHGIRMDYHPIASQSALQDADFYILTLLEHDEAIRAAMVADPSLQAIGVQVRTRMQATAAACEHAIETSGAERQSLEPCTPQEMRWTDAERDASVEAIGRIYDVTPAMQRLVVNHMRPSGFFQLYADKDDRAMLVQAWRDAQSAIDRIIRIYGLGEKPKYGDIDSVIYPVSERYYRGYLANLIRDTARRTGKAPLAYTPTLHFAEMLMEANRRDDAVRQVPLQEKENAATYQRLKQSTGETINMPLSLYRDIHQR
jgi:hypothetical protein